ncbi:hypothetical protein EVJ58_g6822 [Rhodofomes roseus]|uniref:Uncharacterized protein n=1 Tax=Rhodofomes roseus TaxID=34475 RepID=A0A4Y9Y6G4_9APHY|nr:hypothetical protein EVJ58_g6822 [Rhodofomes roseus]
MSVRPSNRTIPYIWRHEGEAEIIKEYLAACQGDRERGVGDEYEAELSDTETICSNATSARGSDEASSYEDEDEAEEDADSNAEGEENSVWSNEEERDDEDYTPEFAHDYGTDEDPRFDPTNPGYFKRRFCGSFDLYATNCLGAEREFLTSFEDAAWYDPTKTKPVTDEEEVRETQRAWDAIALGRPPFDKREALVQWHESLMLALNEVDDELGEKQGIPSKAVKRREPAVVLEEDWNIERVVDELRMRSTIEVAHAPIDNLRRGLVYLARSLYLKENFMQRGSTAYPPTFKPPPVSQPAEGSAADEEESEYIFV